jgi:hypothetical protein
VKDALGRAYSRTEFLEQRREMRLRRSAPTRWLLEGMTAALTASTNLSVIANRSAAVRP